MAERRILVVTGARALSRTPAARLWALRELAARIYSGEVDAVAHGACAESPDDWADTLAREAHIARIRFRVGSTPDVIVHRDHAPVWAARPIAFAATYDTSTPLRRNASMGRWASDITVAGLDVRALSLRCSWPLVDGQRATQGTRDARNRLVEAIGAERVTDLVCPAEHGPSGGDRG